METLQRVFTHILGFAQQPWFSIGETQIDALRLAGLILILLIVWWGGLLFEKTITRVGHDKKPTSTHAGMPSAESAAMPIGLLASLSD
jgi:hypothetical protein